MVLINVARNRGTDRVHRPVMETKNEMIKNLLSSSKELLVAVVPGEDQHPELRFACVSGRHILKTGEGVPEHFSGPCRVSVFSLDSYFEQVDLAAPSPKMLPLVARRHVDAELVFEDEPYRLRAHSRARRERTIAADIAAMPESDLDAATSLLPLQQEPCLQMVPIELAIAALVQKTTSEPVIVFWEKGGVLLSLLISDGMVQTRMRETVTDANRETIIGRAEASLRVSASRLVESREIFLTLYTGDLCGRGPETREKAARVFEDRLASIYRVGRNMPGDAVLRDPELYGLPFVSEDWSFLEEDYRNQVKAWRYAKPAAALASLAGAAFVLVGGFQHLQALGAESDFDDRRTSLNETLAEIDRIRPSDEAMTTVRSGLEVQMQSRNEVRLDRMLDWLTHLVPDGVVIRNLQVQPTPPPHQRYTNVAVNYAPGEKPFQVKMEIMLADTTFDAAEASSAVVVRRLSQRLQMVDSRLDVPAPEPGVRRNVVLMVDAQARAVDF